MGIEPGTAGWYAQTNPLSFLTPNLTVSDATQPLFVSWSSSFKFVSICCMALNQLRTCYLHQRIPLLVDTWLDSNLDPLASEATALSPVGTTTIPFYRLKNWSFKVQTERASYLSILSFNILIFAILKNILSTLYFRANSLFCKALESKICKKTEQIVCSKFVKIDA